MTFECAFDRDNLRRVSEILQDAKCHLLANGSQQNAQNKAYSCLKTKFLGKWKEFQGVSLFLPFECLAFKHFPCRIAREIYCISLRKTPCSLNR